MSRLFKKLLFGIWAVLLVPLLAPVLKKWLDENVLTDPHSAATTAFRDAAATPVFSNLLALGQQPWFKIRAGLPDRNCRWRFAGMVEPEVG